MEPVFKRRRLEQSPPQLNERLRVRRGRKSRSSQHGLSNPTESMQMLLDGETPISDRKNEIIEGMGPERLDISPDNNGEMMEVEFDRNDPSAGSDQGYGDNPESEIDVVGRFAIKTEPTADVSEGDRTGDGVSTEASGSHAMPRVRADANEKHVANVYTVQHKLHTHKIQSGTMHRDRRTNP